MDWSASLLGLDKAFHISSGIGGGAIQGTASDCVLLASVIARIRFKKAHPNVSMEKLVLYVSSQTHSLGVKAAMLLGVQHRILPVSHDDRYALRGEVLRKAYKDDRSSGKWPFCLSECPFDDTRYIQILISLDLSCHRRYNLFRCSG